jgi:hypothetical protein
MNLAVQRKNRVIIWSQWCIATLAAELTSTAVWKINALSCHMWLTDLTYLASYSGLAVCEELMSDSNFQHIWFQSVKCADNNQLFTKTIHYKNNSYKSIGWYLLLTNPMLVSPPLKWDFYRYRSDFLAIGILNAVMTINSFLSFENPLCTHCHQLVKVSSA